VVGKRRTWKYEKTSALRYRKGEGKIKQNNILLSTDEMPMGPPDRSSSKGGDPIGGCKGMRRILHRGGKRKCEVTMNLPNSLKNKLHGGGESTW